MCVVKQLKPQVSGTQGLQVARRLFDTEAQVLYELGSHPQIPQLLAHFEDSKEFYLAQEFIEGHSLTEEFAPATPWGDENVVAFLGDILGTLAFVHGHRVIHRDLKPSNLIRRSKDNRIVLIDFGAVKQASTQLATADPGISHTISIGTQGYMPNEQRAGRPQFSSDVYAVGIMGIQALTGRHPKKLPLDPYTNEIDWHVYAPQANPNLIALLDYMVRYDHRERYAAAGEVLSALQTLPYELARFIPPLTAVKVDLGPPSPQSPQRSPQAYAPAPAPTPAPTPAPPASSPPFPASHTSQTVPVLGRHPHAPVAASSRTTKSSMATEMVRPPAPPRKRALPAAMMAIVAVFGMGLLTWRACTSAPTIDTATTAPDGAAPPANETPLPNTAAAPAPEISDESLSPEAAPISPPLSETLSPEPAPEAISPSPAEAPVTSQSEDTFIGGEADGALTPDTAQTTVSAFYSHVSNQSWDAAQALSAGELAQQFDPNFFQQFQQVSVNNLQVTTQTANTLELLGQNTYVYSDGSTQQEERTFTVQLINGQPRIVASAFVRVIQAR